MTALVEKEKKENGRGGEGRGGYAGVIRLPDKWDHVVAIVHAETLLLLLLLLPSSSPSVFSSYRPPSPIDHFRPTRPTPPFHAGLTISCFLKSLPNWVTRYFHGEEGSIFPWWEGEGKRIHPPPLLLVSLLFSFFFLFSFLYFSINRRREEIFFFRTIVRLSTGTIPSILREGERGGRRNIIHAQRELLAIYSCHWCTRRRS